MADASQSHVVRAAREHIAAISRMLFARHLTDAAGGNTSVRVGNLICMTPTLSGHDKQWQIDADDVLVVDFDGEILEGRGKLSRETQVHLDLHREFQTYGMAVIHAHPRNLMVFAALAEPMPPVIEATRRFGTIPVIPYAASNSTDLAQQVCHSVREQQSNIKDHAAACIAPWHGVFVMAQDLNAAFEAVELLDTNAYCSIMGRQFVGNETQEQARLQMEATIENYPPQTQ